MARYLIIVIALCLLACDEEEANSSDATVHLAGMVDMPGGNTGDIGAVASYWKDGAHTALTSADINSGVTSLFLNQSSVLIGGWKYIMNEASASMFWVDGQEKVIDGSMANTTMVAARNNNFFGVWTDATNWVFYKNGDSQPFIDTASNIWPISMALAGYDFYNGGCSYYQSSQSTTDVQHAQCWKNGQLLFRETEYSNALSVFIHGDDIYMAGHVYDFDPPKSIACYWKNGQRVELTDGTAPSMAKSVYVTDEHVYVGGMLDDQAVYWIDGEIIALTSEGTFSMANSIFIHGADVHVGGYEHGFPAYWKNGARQTIENQDKKGQVKFVVVGEN